MEESNRRSSTSFGFRFYEENELTKPHDEIVPTNGEWTYPLEDKSL
jgi:hypothetical protein